jgi:radical SAM superfamily enzyme YgiQ (UPF0313 family)
MDSRVFCSLGILKVAAVLEQQGFMVDHLDLTGVANYEEAARDYNGGATIFAITATTPQMPSAIRVRRVLKGKTIIGGPHATLVHAAAKRGNERAKKMLSELLAEFDCVVAGDGEKSIFTAIHSRGLIDADDPKSILWQTSKDFGESPWAARHLLDLPSYHYTIDGRASTSFINQLGCPYHCAFCGGRNSPMLRQIRTRTSDSVIAEMLYLHETYGFTGLMAYDDELNVNRSLVELCRKIKATGIDWRLRGFVKAELFTEEQAEAMYDAGFRWLLCGFESAHPRILKNIAKVATLEDNTRMLRTAHKYGLKVKALMSMGHPGDSYETLMATHDWLIEEKPDDFDCTVITLYPGTPYWDESVCIGEPIYRYETNGDALYSENMDFMKEAAYYKGRAGEYRAFVWTEYLTREDLAKLRDDIEASVRNQLGIPYPTSAAELNYEHSVGQKLPEHILRSSS